jgi:geranylgeranyl pyrophosphate synthase
MTEPDLKSFLAACQARVNSALAAWLPASDICPARLHEAMRYAALGGGKRVRPTLVYATGQALGLIPDSLNGAACAVELIHSYSLVHDDLPAMDDDDLRRGRATCHKAFDAATAILVGDALQSLAFQVLASDPDLPDGPSARIAMIDILARASGSRGMAGGQALDLTAEGHELDLAMLENIHIHKTGALIRASVRLATLACTNIDEGAADRLDRYAKCLGLAFQIRDDILDVEGETAVIGKTRGKDQAQEKATYPALLGLAGAREAAATLINDALDSLSIFDQRAAPLRWIADYMVRRES